MAYLIAPPCVAPLSRVPALQDISFYCSAPSTASWDRAHLVASAAMRMVEIKMLSSADWTLSYFRNIKTDSQ